MWPMTRDRKTTNVFTTPWISVERDHVAVGDVAHLVREHGLGLLLRHAVQQAGADRDQRGVAARAGGERVRLRRIEDADLRHADAGGLRLALHGVDEPALGGVGRLRDDPHAHHALGRPLGHRERDERAGEADDGREDQQLAEVEVRRPARRGSLSKPSRRSTMPSSTHDRRGWWRGTAESVSSWRVSSVRSHDAHSLGVIFRVSMPGRSQAWQRVPARSA